VQEDLRNDAIAEYSELTNFRNKQKKSNPPGVQGKEEQKTTATKGRSVDPRNAERTDPNTKGDSRGEETNSLTLFHAKVAEAGSNTNRFKKKGNGHSNGLAGVVNGRRTSPSRGSQGGGAENG